MEKYEMRIKSLEEYKILKLDNYGNSTGEYIIMEKLPTTNDTYCNEHITVSSVYKSMDIQPDTTFDTESYNYIISNYIKDIVNWNSIIERYISYDNIILLIEENKSILNNISVNNNVVMSNHELINCIKKLNDAGLGADINNVIYTRFITDPKLFKNLNMKSKIRVILDMLQNPDDEVEKFFIFLLECNVGSIIKSLVLSYTAYNQINRDLLASKYARYMNKNTIVSDNITIDDNTKLDSQNVKINDIVIYSSSCYFKSILKVANISECPEDYISGYVIEEWIRQYENKIDENYLTKLNDYFKQPIYVKCIKELQQLQFHTLEYVKSSKIFSDDHIKYFLDNLSNCPDKTTIDKVSSVSTANELLEISHDIEVTPQKREFIRNNMYISKTLNMDDDEFSLLYVEWIYLISSPQVKLGITKYFNNNRQVFPYEYMKSDDIDSYDYKTANLINIDINDIDNLRPTYYNNICIPNVIHQSQYDILKPIKSNTIDSTVDTNNHKDKVRKYMRIINRDIIKRSDLHDDSKLKEVEKNVFDAVTPKLKGLTYGSDEYKDSLKDMGIALEHHYENNDHHPEHYFESGETIDLTRMDLCSIIEMLCDWKAASERHSDGDILKSIEFNQKRFKYSDDLKSIFINTVKLLEIE